MALGGLRWLLGLFLGVTLFFILTVRSGETTAQYLAVYIPVRAFEWGVIAAIIRQKARRIEMEVEPFAAMSSKGPAIARWIIAGILISFATDLLSPEMLVEGRFCVGRCLC